MLLVRKKHDQPTQLEWPLFRFISERMSNVASTGVRTINSSQMTDESGYIVIRSHRSLLLALLFVPLLFDVPRILFLGTGSAVSCRFTAHYIRFFVAGVSERRIWPIPSASAEKR